MNINSIVLDIFNQIDFNLIKGLSGSFLVNNVTVSFWYLNRGGEGKVYDIKFKTKDKLYDGFVVKITKTYNYKEHKILEFCSDNVKSKKALNFVKMYAFKKTNHSFIYLLEKVDGDLNKWILKNRSYKEWNSFILQMLFGLHFLSKHKICHRDMKPKNILFKVLDEKTSIKYNNIVVSGVTTLFYISDFGMSESIEFGKKKMSDKEINLCVTNNLDFYELESLVRRIKVSYLIQLFSLDELLTIARTKKDPNIESYLKNSKQTIFNLKLPNKIKDSLLRKKIAYYVVERDFYDFSLLPKSVIKMILPPFEVQKRLEEIFSSKDTIENIIIKYFGTTSVQKTSS